MSSFNILNHIVDCKNNEKTDNLKTKFWIQGHKKLQSGSATLHIYSYLMSLQMNLCVPQTVNGPMLVPLAGGQPIPAAPTTLQPHPGQDVASQVFI